jgi:hypothetical protein
MDWKMIEECLAHLCHFNGNYVYHASGEIEIVETSPSGAGSAVFVTEQSAVVIKTGKNGPHVWSLRQRKCADGAFLVFDDEDTRLHLVELKSKLSLKDWAHALHQFEGMYLTALAVLRLLKIDHISAVTCYIAFTAENVSTPSASPVLLKTLVGSSRTLGGREEWEKELIHLPYATVANVVKGQRPVGGSINFGPV